MNNNWSAILLSASLLLGSITLAPHHIQAAEVSAKSLQVLAAVNFRTQMNTLDNSIIRLLSKGEALTILSKPSSFWYYVKDKNGKTGYVSSQAQYVQEVAQSIASTLKVVYGVNFRTDMNTLSNSKIRMLSIGETLTVLDKPNPDWYHVKEKNGENGYVSSQSKYVVLTSNSVTSPQQDSSKPTGTSDIEKMIAAGMKYLGTPYEFGSSRSNTNTFDCSDFVRQAFLDGLNVKLPSDSREQAEFVRNIGRATTQWKSLKRGDVLFFMDYLGTKESAYQGINKSSARVSHVAIYLGDGKILHTYSKESGGVTISNLPGTHWEYRFIVGGSAL